MGEWYASLSVTARLAAKRRVAVLPDMAAPRSTSVGGMFGSFSSLSPPTLFWRLCVRDSLGGNEVTELGSGLLVVPG